VIPDPEATDDTACEHQRNRLRERGLGNFRLRAGITNRRRYKRDDRGADTEQLQAKVRTHGLKANPPVMNPRDGDAAIKRDRHRRQRRPSTGRSRQILRRLVRGGEFDLTVSAAEARHC
jgi:hypothetical protein